MRSDKSEKDKKLKSPESIGGIKTNRGRMVHSKGPRHIAEVPGKHVGIVDSLDSETYFKLSRNDSVDRQHRRIPLDWDGTVDGKRFP